MALQCDVTAPGGLSALDAYIRVIDPAIDNNEHINFTLTFSVDGDAPAPFATRRERCTYDLAGENPYAQAYAFLASQPEFEGATEV